MKMSYWEYEIVFWNPADNCEESRQGVVPARTMIDALENIEDHYNGVKKVKNLQQIPDAFSDIAIFDFHDMASNFYITPKDEVK